MNDRDPLAEKLNQVTPEVAALRNKNFELERRILEVGDIKKRLSDAQDYSAALQKEIDVLTRFTDRTGPPNWLTKQPRSKKKHHGTPFMMLSDLHLDEVVQSDEVLGMNAYNRDIAISRLNNTAQNFVTVTQDYWTGINYDGAVIPLGGDIFSGDIHEELKETNEDTLLGSVDFWIDPLADVIGLMADTFGKVHIPVVPGNHGRTTRKPRAKMRARSNFDWFIGAQLARTFRNDKRVTFDLSDSADCLIPIYDHRIMLTHGDQASGGQGIGGIWPPLMRLDARKRQRQEAVNQGYDLLIMGHWHSLVFGPSFIVNGSLKGYDEYAFTQNFGYEPPAQAAWLMTPEHGKTWTAPIFSQDRDKEGW
ncbi:hypothetical protein KC887_05120 [Candidatus Kaiserbacteria bacterium]|nr:hypothetical protein [Candidatus Kaiserbacteria bacterium]